MASADETVKIELESGGDNEASVDSVGDAIQTDEPTMDPQEYARLVELYDSSFRNIAEGEVVKGEVLEVSKVLLSGKLCFITNSTTFKQFSILNQFLNNFRNSVKITTIIKYDVNYDMIIITFKNT